MDNVFVPVYLPCFNQVEIIEIAVGPDHAAAVSGLYFFLVTFSFY